MKTVAVLWKMVGVKDIAFDSRKFDWHVLMFVSYMDNCCTFLSMVCLNSLWVSVTKFDVNISNLMLGPYNDNVPCT